MVLNVSSRYGTSTSSNDRNNIINFANTFQRKDLNVKNLTFEEEDKNNKIKNENGTIKDEEQTELRTIISNNLPFTIVIPRQQGSKEADNGVRKYNLKRSVRGTR